MADLDALFQTQESEVARDREIARVLRCPAKDHFAILQINPLTEHASLAATLRKTYRKKSLQIHPDKTKNSDAPRAFDLLKKANSVLSAEPPSTSSGANGDHEDQHSLLEENARYAQKEYLILIYKQVADGLGAFHVDDFHHATNRAIRDKVLLVLEQHEKDRAVETGYKQRQEIKKQTEFQTAAKERELKKSWETRWEQDRDTRVKLWRTFSTKVEKPKKKKKLLA
ncbi:hypothetical protein METBIDRAFT_11151 [Metschnikowia bicuspidata var. bicuspidata NRRL YB-4993]|uniref:J domain-containing protein n=1 Tax=Metschnikowia bicuspidata var. bicuspidata NRRL YB-4993 TaxID=869754 RepID=A0A1A0HE79_9ASCO|nr:hypothetical protein METBIDRAFT_11151 [Metschnikowia bicuspidata var. bicuspidata NRRL YB-4993]OBA22295.1 hypothetical protein METBIDRAFT_11151 [Metschnikowia bicuspidata var. bicuspidata NRRL YB-4993]